MPRLLAFVFLLALLTWAPARAVDPAQRQIVYTRKDGDRYLLHVMNADGTGDREIPGQTANAHLYPAWSPDRKQIACMTGAAGNPPFEIALIKADGSGQTVMPMGAGFHFRPAWSPDGKQLAFPSGEGRPGLILAEPAGEAKRQLTEAGVWTIAPFWSRDGKSVGYTHLKGDGGKSDIVLARVDGGGTEVVLSSENIALAGAGALSDDGRRLCYLTLDLAGGTHGIRIWDFTAKADSIVADVTSQVQGNYVWIPTVAWAPDQKSLLVSTKTEKGFGVFRYSPDGQTKVRLTPEGVDCTHASC
jgi:Tol biopolymer transport system component